MICLSPMQPSSITSTGGGHGHGFTTRILYAHPITGHDVPLAWLGLGADKALAIHQRPKARAAPLVINLTAEVPRTHRACRASTSAHRGTVYHSHAPGGEGGGAQLDWRAA